jgi:hypothetical protein
VAQVDEPRFIHHNHFSLANLHRELLTVAPWLKVGAEAPAVFLCVLGASVVDFFISQVIVTAPVSPSRMLTFPSGIQLGHSHSTGSRPSNPRLTTRSLATAFLLLFSSLTTPVCDGVAVMPTFVQ